MGGDAYRNTVKNLGGDLEDPFKIFPEVQKLYDDRAAELRKIVAERHAAEAQWEKENPEKAAQMREWFSGKAPKIDWSALYRSATFLHVMVLQLVSVLSQNKFLT